MSDFLQIHNCKFISSQLCNSILELITVPQIYDFYFIFCHLLAKKVRPYAFFVSIYLHCWKSVNAIFLCFNDIDTMSNSNIEILTRSTGKTITKLKIITIMKKNFTMAVAAAVLLASCGTAQQTTLAPAVESSRQVVTSLEGQQVISETFKSSGYDNADALNDDGTEIIKRPYKWFAGIGKADNKQVAIELAQREAYAAISRTLNNAVHDAGERGNVVVSEHVKQAVTLHWEQVSSSVEKGCEPFGNVTVEYDPSTRMYNVIAKVAIRGDRFNKMLNSAGDFKPSDLSGEELDQFIEANKAIMEAARGN